MKTVCVRAFVVDDLLQKWLQHLRDFDTANPGCHFEILVDCPDMSVREMVQATLVNPDLKFTEIFGRPRK